MPENFDLQQVYFGSDDAERDEKNDFLRKVFIETSFYDRILRQQRELVIGRKGAGKSAICLTLRKSLSTDGYKVSLITPDALSKQKIEKIGADSVTKEEIYLLTWRYVFLVKTSLEFIDLVEDLKIPSLRYDSEVVREIKGFLGKNEEIRAGFGRNLASLVGVINKVQFNILGSGGGIEKSSSNSSQENLANLIPEFEKTLARGLRYLEDSGKQIFLLVDKVDEIWNENNESKLMISGLLRAAHQFNEKFKNVYVITFLRSDIFDTLKFHDIDKTPGQEERLTWETSDIKGLLARRVSASIVDGSEHELTSEVSILDEIFCEQVGGEHPVDYILSRTLMRPREAIQFCNLSLNLAQDNGRDFISAEDIQSAESRYSEWKLRDLISEYQIQYPYLDILLPMFNGFKVSFSRDDFSQRYADSQDRLKSIYPGLKSYRDSTILKELYDIGFLGISRGEHFSDDVFYSHSKRSGKSPEFVSPENLFIVHPAYRSTLEVIHEDKNFPINIQGNVSVSQFVLGDSNIVGEIYQSSSRSINTGGGSIQVRDIQGCGEQIDSPEKTAQNSLPSSEALIDEVALELTVALRFATSKESDLTDKVTQLQIVTKVLNYLEERDELKQSITQILEKNEIDLVRERIKHELAAQLVGFLKV